MLQNIGLKLFPSGPTTLLVLQRHGDAHLHPECVGRFAFALGDAFDLGCVPGIELGRAAGVFAAARLQGNAPGFAQGLAQRLAEGSCCGDGLTLDLPCQALHHGALTFEPITYRQLGERSGVEFLPDSGL